MPAAPQNPQSELVRQAPTIAVCLSAPAAAVTIADTVEYLQPLSVELTSGGSRIDTAVLEYDFGKLGEHLVDTAAPVGYDREAAVVELDEAGELVRVLAWGKIGIQPYAVNRSGEMLRLIVRAERYLFGSPLGGIPVWEPTAAAVLTLDHDWIFNPEVDERIEGNRSSSTNAAADDHFCFLDPDAIRTDAAQLYQGQTSESWTLAQAVHTLCWSCNPDQTHIANPSLGDLQYLLDSIPAEQLRNHRIKYGLYLPQALDELLTPYGASWFLEYRADGGEIDQPIIRVFRDGSGAVRSLHLQAPGETIDPALSSVEDLQVGFSIVDLANVVAGRSSLVERESTFQLFPLWDPAEDTTDFDDLKTGTDYAKAHPHVGRKFGINTDGSYDDLRPGLIDAVADVLAGLQIILGDNLVAKRRPFRPCLSRAPNEDGQLESRGYYLEWYDVDADGGAAWVRAPWAFSRSEKEAAIYFSGESPPETLWDLIQADPETCRLRITCTLQGDTRLHGRAERQDTSPNGAEVTLSLDLSDKFHDRRVADSSLFYPVLSADQTDDSAALQTYCERIRDVDDCAHVTAQVILSGLDHPEYQIGDVIDQVEGRNLDLNANSPDAGTPRRLQILGIAYDLQQQTTTLLLETIEPERDR